MTQNRTIYILRRLSGLILYGLAYTALYPGLTYPVVTIQGNPTFWSNSRLGIGQGNQFLEPISRSTIDLVTDLFNSRYYFPCGIIFLFSIISPGIKLLVILYGEIVGNIFRVKFDDTSKLVDLRKWLRYIAKYQCVDVFVTIITRQLLNSDFVLCRVESGFYYFSFYSLMSIIAAQVSDTVPVTRPLSPRLRKSAPTHRITSMEAFLLFSSVSMFIVGLSWSIGFPILSVKFLFQSTIVIGETVASLSSFIDPSLATSSVESAFCFGLVISTCVVIPTLVVFLACIIQCCDASRSSRVLYHLAKFTSLLADWSLVDVFAVALLTSLFAFASFSVLRAAAPWGFYCVLMAAMSAFEILKAVHVPDADGYLHLPSEQEGMELGQISSASEEDGIDDISPTLTPISVGRRRTYSPVDKEAVPAETAVAERSPRRGPVVLRSGFLHVILTITKRLGLPFFLLKALGWVIFFAVWWMNSGAGSLDIHSLSATLRSNIPFVTSALRSALPEGIGMCADLRNSTSSTLTTGGSTCIEKPYLHYERNKAYEVLARWLSGFPQMDIVDMYIAVPQQGKFSLNVRGKFAEIKLSLFIGQCLASIFGGARDDGVIPACSKVFDKVHAWSNVTWSIEVEAECSGSSPYVRNIVVDDVQLDREMKIEEEIAFGLKVPLDDLSEHFKQGIKDSIQPLLTKKDGWIPWGPKQYDLTSLLSKLVELNVESHGGTLQFSCPKPRSL